MSESPPAPEVTRLLEEASGGNRAAFDQLFPQVYSELRRLAQSKLQWEREGHTLNATSLVHEAYFRLVGQTRVEWKGRGHFFAIAAQAMRRVLLNYAEARSAKKRGGGAEHMELESVSELLSEEQSEELLALNAALEQLARFNERGARVVEYRFFGGLEHQEIADLMGLSEATVRRAWRSARAWLKQELGPDVSLSWVGAPHEGQ